MQPNNPNTNQQMNPQMPETQGVPVANPVMPMAQPPTMMPTPKKSSGKSVLLLIIIFILIVGMAAYIILAKSQLNYTQNVSTNNTNVSFPTRAPSPTTSASSSGSIESISVASPESDLQLIDKDVSGL